MVLVSGCIDGNGGLNGGNGGGTEFCDESYYANSYLIVNSLPEGANVYLNDFFIGTTETDMCWIEPGTYELRIEKEGYVMFTDTIEIEADTGYAVGEELEAI